MADSKKYNGSTWEHSLRKFTTATDTFRTLPVDIYADGNNATVGISGNTVQSGTPTPDNPVMPQGTGERTGNLVEVSNSNCIIYSTYNQFTITNDVVNITGNSLFGFIVKCSPNTQYTVSSKRTGYNCDMRIREYSEKPSDWTTDFITQSVNVGSVTESAFFTTNSATKYILVCFYGSNTSKISNIMLNTGSTPLPYEPYGIKIPISSANTTTPVYLGEVETTRKVKKLVLTGQETYQDYSYASTNGVQIVNMFETAYRRASGLCNIYPVSTVTGSTSCVWIGSGGGDRNLYFISILSDMGMSTADEFKSYAQQQYAAGTPVTVWYVLANEETGIVNEPLRKIGDYADTVSGITIPTITGADSFDVETTLKPSEVSLSYTGWHDATVKECDGSQWN